jgi:hypothetical protein
MFLIASTLALLVIYAGIKLLIQVQREALGHLLKCVSWFFIIAGFLIIFCAGLCAVVKFCHTGKGRMKKEYKMKNEWRKNEHAQHMQCGGGCGQQQMGGCCGSCGSMGANNKTCMMPGMNECSCKDMNEAWYRKDSMKRGNSSPGSKK